MKKTLSAVLFTAGLAASQMAAFAQTAGPDGSRLSESDVCYIIIAGQGAKAAPMGVTRQTIGKSTRFGVPVLDIVVHQKAGDRFDMRDHFVVREDDLTPLTFESLFMGSDHARLSYGASSIDGRKVGKDGKVTAINLPVSGPVWEGNLFGLTIAALPLAEGKTFSLPKYQYDSGLGTFEFKVVGSETVTTPEGPVEAWSVELLALPEMQGSPAMTYRISKADHRELGYHSPMGGQQLGGDCAGMG